MDARRRRLVLKTVAALSAGDWRGPVVHASPLESHAGTGEGLSHKFRGLRGGQLRVDSLFEARGVNIFDERGKLFFSAASLIPPNGNFVGSYGARFGVPESIRAEWRDRYLTTADPYQPPPPGYEGAFYGGTVLGNHTVPVASRIPDELLDAMRRGVGGFRLKIRLHPAGPLVGWDLSRGFNLHYFAGGDFREADIENGKVLRRGWYVHPRSGQRFETDF